MNDEMHSIHKNNTWELVQLSKDKHLNGVKWIYKVKYHLVSLVEQHNARLVAKGFSQAPRVDYIEIFSHAARLDTINTISRLLQHNTRGQYLKWI